MSQFSQKEAVYNAITAVLQANNIPFEDGMNVSTVMTKELRAQVNAILFEGFRAGAIALDREFDDSELKAYSSGLQSNWLRKDTRINGAVKFVTRSTGARKHSSDPQVKELNKLLKTLSSDEDRAEVQAHINARITELSK